MDVGTTVVSVVGICVGGMAFLAFMLFIMAPDAFETLLDALADRIRGGN